MKDLAVIVNTHSSTFDVWPLFYDQFNIHYVGGGEVPTNKFYVFSDKLRSCNFGYFEPILYDETDDYRTQFLSCLKNVEEEFVLHLEEDYILYRDVQGGYFFRCMTILRDNPELDFIKLVRGPEELNPSKYSEKIQLNLYDLDNKDSNFYTNQPTIWRTRSLEKIYERSPKMGIADKGDLPMFEPNAYKYCHDINGVFFHHQRFDYKIGKYHYSSWIFPYIATAIIKGKWNLKEYERPLQRLLNKYGIDSSIRGDNR